MIIAGYASTEAIDGHGQSISRHAFDRDLFGVNLCIAHDVSRIAGVITYLAVQPGGLFCHARLDPTLPDVKPIASSIASGSPWFFSIGGRRLEGWRTITKLDLHEITITDHPANQQCVVKERPRLWPDDIEELQEAQYAASAAHKEQIKRRRQWMTAKLATCGLRSNS